MSASTSTPAVRLDTEDLRSLANMDDAIRLLTDAGIAITDASDLIGDGFVLGDKKDYVNVPFILIGYNFAEGDFSGDFVVLRIVTADGRKAVLTDGSTGLREQMRQLQSRGITAGVMVKRGLTVSEYDYTDEKGNTTKARTYYLSV